MSKNLYNLYSSHSFIPLSNRSEPFNLNFPKSKGLLELLFKKVRERTVGRDPPGIGFKSIPEGHYNVDNKRLLNVAEAKEQNDAAKFNLLQRLVQ